MIDQAFFKGKKILVTGHTGFKGSWMCRMLELLGAEVTGYARKAPTTPSMFELCGIAEEMDSVEGDIRDLKFLQETVQRVRPELVVHMAAQPIVREGYRNPVYTYDVNVMGTVNILESIRSCASVKSFLNVTTDKVYKNHEWEWGYRENEELNGYDPYSNSKSCSELVTESYRKSFFEEKSARRLSIATARAGNVIGGGDFAADRILPDCVRAAQQGKRIFVRNPHSVRPYQHVLEPVAAYLLLLQRQYENPELAGSYNVGPDEDDCWETGRLADTFCESWERYAGKRISWYTEKNEGPHEARFLKLDCTRLKRKVGWEPCWNAYRAVEKTAEWYAAYVQEEDIRACMDRQIREFLAESSMKCAVEQTRIK